MFSLTAIIVALRVYGLRTIRTQGLAFILVSFDRFLCSLLCRLSIANRLIRLQAQYQNVLALAKQIRA